ncbi:MAG: hypothetical protein KAS72_11890 [Phycisphaerales bacterium]|nr:hypothetical protein [Phycisphaerales bacterium]
MDSTHVHHPATRGHSAVTRRTHPIRPVARLVLMAFITGLLTACGQPQPTTYFARRPAVGAIRAERVFAQHAGVWRYEATDSRGGGAVIAYTHSTAPLPDDDADLTEMWRVFRPGVEDSLVAIRTDGSVVVPSSIDLARGKLTRFSPPLLHMPAELRADEAVIQEVRMAVYDVRRPERLLHDRPARHTIRYVGDETVTGPLGRYDTRVIEWVLEAQFGPAHVHRVATFWIDEQHGVVARRYEERITILGVPASAAREELHLIAAPATD